jgi:protein involved in polysaccharide export with SLBB domain
MSMRREFVTPLCVLALAVMTVAFGINRGVAGSQETGKGAPAAGALAPKKGEGGPGISRPQPADRTERAKREAVIRKMVEGYDLKARAAAPIPDDPPPHEGAMIGLPYIVEPPDLIIVEVLEALPGRPISGERLVKPDGTINLGFYGEVHVKGLTLEQVKVAIVKHLRTYLTDESLGLEVQEEADTEEPVQGNKGQLSPFGPATKENPADNQEQSKPRSSALQRGLGTRPAVHRSASRGAVASPSAVLRLAEKREQDPPPPADDDEESWIVVSPEKSGTVFVDVTAYNSKHYYVQGDILTPGRLPWTGNETVLDVLNFAGGFLPTAEVKDIRLVRPARGGKPAKVLNVNFEAIQDQGDVTSNYQIFPGDRLIVGRNEVVKRTVEMDRLNAPIQSITGTILQEANMLRALQTAGASDREALLKEYVEFWAKALAQKGDFKFDEQTLREALIRKMKLTPSP